MALVQLNIRVPADLRASLRAEAEEASMIFERYVVGILERRHQEPVEEWSPAGVVELNELRSAPLPQASDHPGRMTAHGAAAAFNKDVSDVRRDPSYRALDDTVLPLTFEQEQRRLATPMRKSQLELEAEEMDRKQPRPDPFKKGLKNDD